MTGIAKETPGNSQIQFDFVASFTSLNAAKEEKWWEANYLTYVLLSPNTKITAVQRTKEVGIRKVLGATVGKIIYLFSKEFTLLIGIAFLIAGPVAYYVMNGWLQNFTFRIRLGVSIFLVAIVLSIVIAWVTVGYRAVRAALANPVKSLRTE